MSSIVVMTTDRLDALKIADSAWQSAKAEVEAAAEWRKRAVREARESGLTLQEIADVLGVSVAAVSDMARGRGSRWKEARREKS